MQIVIESSFDEEYMKRNLIYQSFNKREHY